MLISTILLAAEDMGPNPIAPENKELFWGAGTFLVFLFVMRVFLVPKVRKGMEARYGEIRQGHESAEATRAAAQNDVAAYEAALAEVRAEAAARIDKARQTLDAERQAKVAEANSRIAAKRAEADKALDAARAAARGEVAAAVGNVASRAAQLVLGKAPDAAIVKKAVDSTMSGGRS
ncbi:MAG: synthase subunit [Actinomycetota bacterium]|jgi:F-type H+-transporting ATPase subunit b|nr:F0F1 ATP synthase subunit B [Actinomycetota bacterium]